MLCEMSVVKRIECTERSIECTQYLRYSETDKEENRSPAGTHDNTWSAGDYLWKSSLVGSISNSVPT